MVEKKKRIRKLLLVIALLLMDTEDSTNNLISLSKENNETKLVWLADEAKGKCLGLHGFSECSNLNIWQRLRDDNDEILLRSTHSTKRHKRGTCLGRSRNMEEDDRLEMVPCSTNPLSASLWRYNSSESMLSSSGVVSKLHGKLCVDDNGKLTQCKYGHAPITLVELSSVKPFAYYSQSQTPALLQETGSYICPTTYIELPRNLDRYESHGPKLMEVGTARQVLMGAGLYSRVNN